MKYYAVQVKTTQEEKYIQCAAPKLAQRRQSERLLFLRRRLPVRKGGKTTMQLSPLFPGYVFLETEDLDAALHNTLRRTPGFFRFLRSTQQPTELCDKDLATLHHFMSFGEVVEPSAVYFDENDRIVVDSGPLKGLEGRIVKVDRRKNRAKIQLDMYTDNFLIDLAFQVITKGSEQTEQSEQSERSETEQAERGERIERLERLERLERIEQIEQFEPRDNQSEHRAQKTAETGEYESVESIESYVTGEEEGALSAASEDTERINATDEPHD